MTTPVLYLKRDYDLVETMSKEVKRTPDGDKYLCIVFKNTYGEFCYYYHDCEQPYAFHDIATGFATEEEARSYMYDEIGVGE